MVDAIRSKFHDYYCKYLHLIFPLFVGAKVEVNERPEFTTNSINGGPEVVQMDVGTYRGSDHL
jgi:hypothetical protein